MEPAPRRPEVVNRVGALLREVGRNEPGGASTSDISRKVEVSRPTVHRLLTSLTREGLIDRDSKTGLWHLGPELFLLGTSAAARYDVSRDAAAVVRRLAQETGESAFLSARRGEETVCLRREDGSFPLRSHVLHEGIRFPLGVASAGLVILAHMQEHETEEFLRQNDLSGEWGDAHRESALRERIAETRVDGYATNPGLVVEGSWGMAAAVFDKTGAPAWALTLTGVESRFPAHRRPGLGRLLLDEAHRLTRLLG